MVVRAVTGDRLHGAILDSLAGGPAVLPLAPHQDAGQRFAGDEPLEHPDAAAIISTSGSTGQPRGVVLTRSALRASVAATHERLGGQGSWVCPLPLHFVAGFMTLVRAAVAQTSVQVVPSDLSQLPIVTGERNYLSLVAAQLHRALELPTVTRQLAAFDAILVGGSAIPAGLIDRARDADLRVVATYGMTETCGGCVYDGAPLAGVQITVDTDQRIWIAGDVLFAGYRLDPTATASALVDGWLRTHDRGELQAGRLEVLGRDDDVVITGGVNVDLAAAQRVADASFGPEAVVLLGVPDDRFGVRIVAVAITPVGLEDVRERLGAHLSAAALPRELRVIATPPRTPTGKIDRRKLITDWVEGRAGWPR